jgi:hypothetical protein
VTPFFFDGNQWSGTVDSAAKWRLLVGAYPVMDKLLSAKMAPQGAIRALPIDYHLAAPGVLDGAMPSFGIRREHIDGTVTLGEWARAQGMDLRALADA